MTSKTLYVSENNYALEGFSGEETIITESFVFFWKPPSIYGQWTPSTFTVEGSEYSCAEQFMMAEKARLFEDFEILQKILMSNNPAQHKALGRKIKNFNSQTWNERKLAIVVQGNEAKFGQNQSMKQELLDTGERTLVEASPYDKVWGIGMSADNPGVLIPKNWRGQNLLGKALMTVREGLK